jgi:hypothetical protein
MRTATDLNQFYAVRNRWRVLRAKFRDQVFRKRLSGLVAGRSVLELGYRQEDKARHLSQRRPLTHRHRFPPSLPQRQSQAIPMGKIRR